MMWNFKSENKQIVLLNLKMTKMKRTIFFSMLGAMALLASCNQNDDLLGNNPAEEKAVTFSLQTQQPLTRAAGEGLRYVVAIYDEAGTTEVKGEQTFNANNFSIMLASGKYTCLFWADYGEANYNAANLTIVTDLKNTSADANAEAFFAKQSITVSDGSAINVELKRAVAQVILKENNVLEAGTVKVTFDRPLKFNVNGGTTSEVSADTKSIIVSGKQDGSTTAVELGHFYVLAPTEEAQLKNFKIQYEEEAERVIANVPIQANYKTNITGKYGADIDQQFTISVNTEWGTPDNEGTLLRVGSDYYPNEPDRALWCSVISSSMDSAVAATVYSQSGAADKAAAIAAAKSAGGRLVTYDEFIKMVDLKLIPLDSTKNYYCDDFERCWYGSTVGHDNSVEANLPYYIAFDITE